MSKEESFEDYWSEKSEEYEYHTGEKISWGKFDSFQLENTTKAAWNHQQAKLDKANEETERTALLAHKLYEDNQDLIEALKLAVEFIGGCRGCLTGRLKCSSCRFLESETFKKVEGSL